VTSNWIFIDTQPSTRLKRKILFETAAAAIEAASRQHGVSIEQIVGRRRTRPICRARWEAMAIMRAAGMSLPEIGGALNRHHTTVMHALEAYAYSIGRRQKQTCAVNDECVASTQNIVRLESAQPMEIR
jgi:chromosomal replication initiation ATPase DnaA